MNSRCPVCNREVDALRARAVSIWGGRTFYFCTPEHKEAFARDPAAQQRSAGVVASPSGVGPSAPVPGAGRERSVPHIALQQRERSAPVPTLQPPVASAPIVAGEAPPADPESVVEAEPAAAPAAPSSRTRLYILLIGLAVAWLVGLYLWRRGR